ncbi:hypothetical protein ES703_13785 [subsurface metagenome]
MSEPVLNVSEGKQTGYVSLSLRVVFHIRNGSNLGFAFFGVQRVLSLRCFSSEEFFYFLLVVSVILCLRSAHFSQT